MATAHPTSKLPQVTLLFWVMKICATTLGETAGDLLSMTLNIGYGASTLLLLSLFVAALTAQLRSKVYQPWLYWAVILATSTAGTTLSDFLDRSLGLGYWYAANWSLWTDLVIICKTVGILLNRRGAY